MNYLDLSPKQRELLAAIYVWLPMETIHCPSIRLADGRDIPSSTGTMQALERRLFVESIPQIVGYLNTPGYRLTGRALTYLQEMCATVEPTEIFVESKALTDFLDGLHDCTDTENSDSNS